jgi:phosphoglycolate phosphatase
MRYLQVARWKLPAIAADARWRMAGNADRIALFDGIVPMLRSLKQTGLVVAAASSNEEANVRRILGPEATALVDAFECGAAVFGKAGEFRRLMKRLGAAPGETICIGGETRDIEAAKAVGAACGAALWGYATAEALARFGPTLTFATPAEITRRLASCAA